jgi:hypothetical protein
MKPYVDVTIDSAKDSKTGKAGRYFISNSKYAIGEDELVHAFTVYWPDGTVKTLVLNPQIQAVTDWKNSLVQKLTNPKKDDLAAILWGAVDAGKAAAGAGVPGLFVGGPIGGVIAASAGVGIHFRKEIHDLLKDFWGHFTSSPKQPFVKQGYYDVVTGEPALNFKQPIHVRDIVVIQECEQLSWEV